MSVVHDLLLTHAGGIKYNNRKNKVDIIVIFRCSNVRFLLKVARLGSVLENYKSVSKWKDSCVVTWPCCLLYKFDSS